ncbi:MAG TPA: cytochrome C oxidase subunit IV family protein [Candidatus Sulfotelmatobacter sp.]|nr:cytochrome C oxidase subunit IV family protein [Candidatus Sulfotelmatobacter sp.]
MSNPSTGSMKTTYIVYGAILAIAVIQIVAAIAMGPSLGRMLILAAIQAYLAVMFFMHLRDEKSTLRLALIPGTIFVLVMMNMIWADSFRLISLRPFAK